MKTFFKRYKKLHLWLLTVLVILALHFALRPCRGLMNFLTQRVLFPLERGIAGLCSVTSASVAELGYITAVLVLILYAAWTLKQVIFRKERGAILYRFVLSLLCAVLSIYALFCLLWGVTYHADSFAQRAGITPRGGTVEELTDLTAYFAGQLSDCADEVPRDENGLFAVPRAEIFAESTAVYKNLYEEFPFLEMTDHTPKAVALSEVMSAIDFTGFYFPFTGEANLNVDSPACFLPATIVHEMAHQRLIASEQECNFVAILGAARSDSAAYRYSGWLLGYIHLSNALYGADQEAWQTVRDMLPETVVADIRNNNAYWASWRGPVKDAAQSVYDGFLKANGEEAGIQSYGTVVDMLLAYYG